MSLQGFSNTCGLHVLENLGRGSGQLGPVISSSLSPMVTHRVPRLEEGRFRTVRVSTVYVSYFEQ